MRNYEDIHSTFLKWLRNYANDLEKRGGHLLLEGVEPYVMKQLQRTGVIDVVGKKHVFKATPVLDKALQEAIMTGQELIVKD